MKDTKVILISGKARHGKDTLAGFLKEELMNEGKSVIIYHFADALKSLCENSYGWIRGDKGEVGRTLLQNVGSEYRKNNLNCWVNIAKQIIRGTNASYVIIPDCRYKNEANIIKKMNGIVIRIEREDFDNQLTKQQKMHKSETEMDNYSFDVCIENDGALENLHDKAAELVKKLHI